MTLNALTKKWEKAKRDLDAAKAEELELRKELEAEFEEGLGTKHLESPVYKKGGKEYWLKLVRKENTRLDKSEIDTVRQRVHDALGKEAELWMVNSIIQYKPQLIESGYKALIAQSGGEEGAGPVSLMLQELSSAITVTPATPTLTLVAKEPSS